jgi:gliding motility-associated-like protein
MKKILLLLALLFSCAVGAQVYPMQNGSFSTCSGTFYDSGGAAGNYGANEVYQITFCPSTPGSYVQLNFSVFDIEGEPFDYMTIYEGTGTAGAVIGTYGLVSPMDCSSVIASSHPSGCITVRFVSDGSFQYGGWAATISCTTTPGGVASSAPSNAVCSGANPFCADAGPLEFPNISDGGCVADAPTDVTDNTCLITAPNPAWYYLEIGIAGNVNLEIEQTTGPNGTGTGLDVDYAIWGPFANAAATCADFTQGDCIGDHSCTGNVVDCSFSIDAVETATIPGAQIGEIYMVLITNFDGAPGYISMTQTNAGNPGAGSTDCSIVCPTYAGTNPTTCGATNGSITISGLDPNTTYTVNYLDDLSPIGTTVASNAAGVAVITGLNAGNYTNIITSFPGCTSAAGAVLLTAAAAPSVTSIVSNTPICAGGSAIFTITGTANATVTYNINSGGSQTVVLSAAGTATVTVTPALANVTLNAVSIAVPACSAPLAISRVVVVNSAPTITLTSAAATNSQTLCVNSPITSIVYTIANGGTGATVSGLPTGVTGSFSAGQFIITGTPTVTGTFNYTVSTTGGCSFASAVGTITVNTGATIALFSAVATTNQTLCANTAIASIVYAIGGGATGATVLGLPAGVTGSFAAGQFTISGSPTATGTFNYTVTTTGGCGSASLGGTITVNAGATMVLFSAAAATNQTLCVSTSITSIVYTIGGGATGATVLGLPTGVTGSFAAGQFTISGTPTATGTFNYNITTTGGCGSVSLGGTITVNPNAAIALFSAAATTNQTVCINTPIASIAYTIIDATGATVLGLPAGVTGSFSAGQFTISGSPSAAGTFNYTVTTTGGCASASLGGTIAINPDATIALSSTAATTTQTLCVNTPIASIVYTIGGGATGATVLGLPTGVTGSFAAGQFTISGTPTASGTFNYTVATTGGCASASLGGTIAVNSDATIAQTSSPGTETQTICITSSIAPITYLIANGGTGATVLGLPSGLTGIYAGGVFTISGTPTASGVFNFTVNATGSGCASPSLSGTITINVSATIALFSAATTTNQTLCINTSSTSIVYAIGGGATGATVIGLPAGVTGTFSAGQFTISGTPTAFGTFNYTITTTGGCASASLGGTVTVNPDATIALFSAAATTNQILCINTPIAPIIYTIGGGGTGATVLGLPAGVTGSFAAGQFTIGGTPTATGTFNYTVTTTGGCASASLGGTITVNPDATIALFSAAATTNQTLCINTPITPIEYTIADGGTGATVSGLPTGVTGSFSAGQFTISGTPTVTGIFNYTVMTTGGCASASLGGTIITGSDATIALLSAVSTANQTLCINTPIAPIIYTIGGGGTGATVIGLPTGINGNYAGGQFTINGTPAVSGIFNYTVTATGACASASLSGTITVNPDATIALFSAAATTNQVLCINTPITPIEYTIADGGTGATVLGLPTGVTGSFSAGQFTISGTPTVTGTFNYTVTTTGGCASASLGGTITINPDATIALFSASATSNQTLCINTPITSIVYAIGNATGTTVLGLPTGITGSFSAGQLTISGTPTVTGIFNYTVTTTGGCASASLGGTITVNLNASLGQLTPAGTETQTVCIHTPITNIAYLIGGTATGATVVGLPTGVTGIFAAGVITISGTPTAAGIFNYTVTATGSICSSPTLAGTITVNADVTMVLSSTAGTTSQTVCINNGISEIKYNLGNGATGATVIGLPAGVNGNFASGVFTISGIPTASGTFNYTVTTTGGCGSVAANGTLTVNPNATLVLQSASATINQVVCIGTPITPITYQTGNGATGAVTSVLPAGITANYAAGILTISGIPSVSGVFNFTITTTGGCLSVALAAAVSINPNVTIGLSSAPATASQVICANTPMTPIAYLVGNGATGATVSGLPVGFTSNFAAGTLTIAGSSSTGGVYNYSVATTGGCSSATLNGSISITELPTATIAYGATPYCNSISAAQYLTLNGTGAYLGGTYSAAAGLWLNAGNGAISPALSTPGTYTVTYTIPSFGGCPSVIATTTVRVTETPTATIAYDGPYCTSVNATQPVTLNGTAAYIGGNFTSTAGLSLNSITGAINPSLSTPGTYTVAYAIPASGGCASVPVTTSVTVNATPIVVATPDATAICTDETVNINLTSLVAGTTYQWTVAQINASGASNGNGNLISQTLAATGNSAGWATYTIIPTSPAGCIGNAVTVSIMVNPLPKPHLEGGVICRNPNTGMVMRSYILNTGLNNIDYDFLWLHNTAPISGATDNTYEAVEGGIYTVIATNIHTGCISYPVDAAVLETEVAEIAIITGNDAFIDNPIITVTVVGTGNYEYQLDNGAFQASNVFNVLTIGEHTIHVRDLDDCTDITTAFTVIGYPKFFTPNGDGYNDTWNIKALADQQASKISIFDRYGKLIKQISPGGDGWDGTLNGHPLPSTDYWFVVEYLDQQINKEFKAHFSLKR